jgi:hypothetical protein
MPWFVFLHHQFRYLFQLTFDDQKLKQFMCRSYFPNLINLRNRPSFEAGIFHNCGWSINLTHLQSSLEACLKICCFSHFFTFNFPPRDCCSFFECLSRFWSLKRVKTKYFDAWKILGSFPCSKSLFQSCFLSILNLLDCWNCCNSKTHEIF